MELMSTVAGLARLLRAPLLGVVVAAGVGCALPHRPMTVLGARPVAANCRVPLDLPRVTSVAPRPAAHPAIAWMAAADEAGRTQHDAWCRTVGPPVTLSPPSGAAEPSALDALTVVSWNVHAGAADVEALVRQLRAGAYTGGRPVGRFVLLLQEAHREGDEVPAHVAAGIGIPGAAGLGPTSHVRTDVVAVARTLGLSLYYVPSMRNGPPERTSEDRGNAILSTEPLADFGAIELPFERQRRVAVVASLSGRHPDGEPWTLRVASVHLESTASARRLRVFATGPRVRQARGLLEALGTDAPIVVGGDFNTWFGFADPTYRTMTEAWPDASVEDRRRTFGRFFRLDHVFADPPEGWQVRARRLDVRLGSDHYPLLAEVRPPATYRIERAQRASSRCHPAGAGSSASSCSCRSIQSVMPAMARKSNMPDSAAVPDTVSATSPSSSMLRSFMLYEPICRYSRAREASSGVRLASWAESSRRRARQTASGSARTLRPVSMVPCTCRARCSRYSSSVGVISGRTNSPSQALGLAA